MRQPGGLHSDSIPELHVFEIAVGRSHLLPNRLEATAPSGQERSNSPFRFIQIPIALLLPLLTRTGHGPMDSRGTDYTLELWDARPNAGLFSGLSRPRGNVARSLPL
jgi:hypothetical protein